MRILHTADWHLGVQYMQRSRYEEQARFLDWLLDTIEARQIDVLVVAGDVFDTVNPPAEALQLYYRFLARLGSRGDRTAIIIGGNHDSASRLEAPREVLSALSVHVVGGHAPERAARELGDAAGLLVPVAGVGGEVRLVVLAVPFLNDWRLGVRGFDGSVEEQRQSLHEAFRGVYARLADKAQAAFPGVPMMATGHLTCLPRAGDPVTAEDAIPAEINRVGTLGAMGPGIFDERLGYVALGHIHRGFAVDAGRRVWYAGTPVQVGAEEPWQARRVLLVTDGAAPIESIQVPTTRRIVKLSGAADDIRARLSALTWGEDELPPYVVVEALVTALDPGLGDALRLLVPAGPAGKAQLVEVRTRLLRAAGASDASVLDTLPMGDAVTPEEAFLFAWRAKHGDESTPPGAVMQRFRALLENPDALS